MEPVIDKRAVYDEDGKIFFESHFKVEITQADVDRNKAFLKSNITRINQDLRLLNVDNAVNEKRKILLNDKKIKEEAMKNYDKYISDEIISIKRDKAKNKLRIHQELVGFEKYMETILAKEKAGIENEINTYKNQLEHDEEQLGVYEAYEKKSTKTKE